MQLRFASDLCPLCALASSDLVWTRDQGLLGYVLFKGPPPQFGPVVTAFGTLWDVLKLSGFERCPISASNRRVPLAGVDLYPSTSQRSYPLIIIQTPSYDFKVTSYAISLASSYSVTVGHDKFHMSSCCRVKVVA